MEQVINNENIMDFMHKVLKTSDLKNVYDLWMILIRPKNSNLKEDEGILSFVGAKTNQESYALYKEENIIIPIFNDSTELDGDIYYEE